ncbi:thioredoxin domain [Bacillus phage G]|uniref:Gp80 n=1 Tax=Bacillus phage G TaxID=2884420 RepID=G3MBF0_9CAUD|nr:thioredoxin domain [Bacillus phage G]AEO93351.1 gp80 [Bacillus phage G]
MKVVVYSQPDCGPCKMVKAYLNHKGIDFEEKNIREDEAAYKELVAQNFSKTPVTFIDGEPVVDFNIEELNSKLNIE